MRIIRCAMCGKEITSGYVIDEWYGRKHFCSEDCVKDYIGEDTFGDEVGYEECFDEQRWEYDDLIKEDIV